MGPYYIYNLIGNKDNRHFNYIGSTPNVYRRLRQHNGILKGGAKYTSNKLSYLNTINGLQWNYKFIIMTFFNKNNALSLEWHLKRPFLSNSSKSSQKKKTKYNVLLNDEIYSTRTRKMDNNYNIMLKQIDITLSYVKQKNNIQNDQIFIFMDSSNKNIINYLPINYKLIYFDDLTNSIYQYNTFKYFNEL
jgi:predicted GIY-YIG superfamily endonuclease